MGANLRARRGNSEFHLDDDLQPEVGIDLSRRNARCLPLVQILYR